jgi:hypothetical protein
LWGLGKHDGIPTETLVTCQMLKLAYACCQKLTCYALSHTCQRKLTKAACAGIGGMTQQSACSHHRVPAHTTPRTLTPHLYAISDSLRSALSGGSLRCSWCWLTLLRNCWRALDINETTCTVSHDCGRRCDCRRHYLVIPVVVSDVYLQTEGDVAMCFQR